MKRILIPTRSPDSWRDLLADPRKHWRTGFSARTLAHCWEAADGLPPEVRRAFAAAEAPHLRSIELLFAIPEFQTALPGGSRPSCTDLMVIARHNKGLAAVAVEGKVAEEFGPHVNDWKGESSRGRVKRLAFLQATLGLASLSLDLIRYQLIHRAASAVLEARRIGASDAVLLVHSFSPKNAWFDDYAVFLEAYDVQAKKGVLHSLADMGGLQFHAAWVSGAPKFLTA